ncbi:NAD-dependent epimerase/dehydratase family protein [Aeromonas sp. QDB11]|uniref:NAD-dependent epimerase/dehydratase family protein n=1 Tax=Aeromonas sp. QDB11 TaxID=2990482 RepID=UPI0022E639CF|nr:NAD-dependent epimerase/dehydratase family protein [Aeromonas sp. QDB11]
MKILITGSTGFIGREVIAQKADFRCVIRDGESLSCDDVFIIGRLDKSTCWDAGLENINAVIHLAGIAHNKNVSQDDFRSVNTEGTLHLAREAARLGVKRFVFVSSIGVNGTFTDKMPFNINSIANPHNHYAQSKYEAELGLKEIADETGLEVVIVRPTLVYGVNAPGNFGMLTKLVRLLPFLPFGLVNNRRSFISVKNIASLLLECATNPNAAGHIFLASDGDNVSTKKLTNAIAEGLGKKVIQLPIPTSFMRLCGKLTGKSAVIEQLLGNLEVDSSNLQEVLGWTPPLSMSQAMASLRELK